MVFPSVTVEFSPATGPFDTPVWVDISERVLSLSWTVGRQRDLQEWPPGEATIVLRNDDRLFDPEHTAGTYFGDLLPRVPFRIQAVYDSVTYDLFYGFVEDGWEQGYQPPAGSVCTVQLVDMLAVLEGYTLPSVMEAEILADAPVAYWPLDEPTGDIMGDRSGHGYDGTYTSGTTGLSDNIGSGGVETIGLRLDGEHLGIVRDAGARVPELPFVFEALVSTSEAAEDLSDQNVFRQGAGGGAAGMTIAISSAVFGIRSYFPGNFLLLGVIPAGFLGHLHHLAVRVTVSALTFYVDGVQFAEQTTPSTPSTEVSTGSTVGGDITSSFPGDNQFNGDLAHVAVYGTDIGAARIVAHSTAAFAPLDGQRSDEQVEWILEQVGVPSVMFDLDVGASIMGPLNSRNRNALELLREITATEQGALYVDHSNGGKLKFRYRYFSWLETRATISQATFSDDPDNTTAARVEPDTLNLESNGVASIRNRATVSWAGGEETSEDTASSVAYGPRNVSISTQAKTPAIARGIGEWIVAHNGQPHTRVQGFGVHPAADPLGWEPALGLRSGDRVTYRQHPQSVGTAVSRQLEVLGVSHRVEGVDWMTDWYVTNAPSQQQALFLLGSSLMGGTDILAY